jgi:NADH-quinone oxidoreductase subunit C
MSDETKGPPPPAPGEAEAAAEAARAKAAAEAAARAKAAAEAEAAKPPWERDPATPAWLDAASDPLAQALRQRFGEAILAARSYAGDLTVEAATGAFAEVAHALKAEHGFNLYVDLCGADHPKRGERRFDVVLTVHRMGDHRRVRLKTVTDEATPVPTVSGVWKGANWSEREAYDMYGIRFAGHPDMTRILLWEGFGGHPLRKDFPVEGIDTGSAIYPEYYAPEAGPIAGTGTGWKAPKPPAPEPPPEPPAAGGTAKPT